MTAAMAQRSIKVWLSTQMLELVSALQRLDIKQMPAQQCITHLNVNNSIQHSTRLFEESAKGFTACSFGSIFTQLCAYHRSKQCYAAWEAYSPNDMEHVCMLYLCDDALCT